MHLLVCVPCSMALWRSLLETMTDRDYDSLDGYLRIIGSKGNLTCVTSIFLGRVNKNPCPHRLGKVHETCRLFMSSGHTWHVIAMHIAHRRGIQRVYHPENMRPRHSNFGVHSGHSVWMLSSFTAAFRFVSSRCRANIRGGIHVWCVCLLKNPTSQRTSR